MGWFKSLFGGTTPENKVVLEAYDEHDRRFIEGVIGMLRDKPEVFSARWFGGIINRSVKENRNGIMIMIDTGQIIAPIKPKMSSGQKEECKRLVGIIVKRDSDYLIDKLFGTAEKD